MDFFFKKNVTGLLIIKLRRRVNLTFLGKNPPGNSNSCPNLSLTLTFNGRRVPFFWVFFFFWEGGGGVQRVLFPETKFNGSLYFSHSKSNSYGVFKFFHGNMNFCIENKLMDKTGQILVLDTEIEDSENILINFYNTNVETQ